MISDSINFDGQLVGLRKTSVSILGFAIKDHSVSTK